MTSRKSSILKPLRVREPLQDLSQLLPVPNNDEEETTTTTDNLKRRVSFARINKIKEFETGAECTTLLHTPAYDERYSISSDSYQSSLCESTNKSTFEPSLMKSSNPLNYSKANDDNVDIVEVGLMDVTRGASSPGKMSVGDSSMDITNMVSPDDYILEQTTSECLPLNLTKNYISRESIVPSNDDKDTLDSSSMETTEALPCALTETILTNYENETYSPDVETSVDDDSVFQFVDNVVFSNRRLSRKSEIFPKEKRTTKRLSDEMIDPEHGIVPPKRRSLTNDSCSDESSANIVIPKMNDTSIIKEQNNVKIDNSSEKSKISNDDNQKPEDIPPEEKINKCDTTTLGAITESNQSQEEIVLLDDVPNQIEQAVPQSVPVETETISLHIESTISYSAQIEIKSTVSAIAVESNVKNPIDDPETKQSSDNDECHLKNTESSNIIEAQLTLPVVSEVTQENILVDVSKSTTETSKLQNVSNHVPKEMEITRSVSQEMKSYQNESNHITKDMEITRPVSQEMKSYENESNHITKDMDITRPITEETKAFENESNHITKDMEITQAVREEMNEIISLICSQNDSKTDKNTSEEAQDEGKCSGADENTSDISSMVVEYDLEDVLGNLKAVNITENEQDSFIPEDGEITLKLEETGSLEIVKNLSDQVIVVTESSTENDPVHNENETDQLNDVSMHLDENKPTCKTEINVVKKTEDPKLSDPVKLKYQQMKWNIADKIKKMIECEKSDWSIKLMNDEEWIFEALWNRLQLAITFEDENKCEARLCFKRKEPEKVDTGDEILRIAIGPLARKYKRMLDKLCSKVEDVEHLLKLISPSITFARKFAEDFTYTQQAENINLADRKATFHVAGYKNHFMVKIEVNMKLFENLNLSDLNIVPIIGNVNKNLIYKIFTEAGRDYNFTSKFVKTLWQRMDN